MREAGMRTEDPEGVEHGAVAIEWGSDAVAEVLRRLGLRYVALVPGSSYRGLHDSLVNYNGNRDPQMLVCLRHRSPGHRDRRTRRRLPGMGRHPLHAHPARWPYSVDNRCR